MQIKAIKTGVFKENQNLAEFIFKYVKKLSENSILVIASKVVALSEGRTVEFKDKKQKVALIQRESDVAIKTKMVWLTVKDGLVMADAGIDESNAQGKLILLPEDSFVSADKIRSILCRHFKIKNLGIIISDSALLPLRAGVIAQAIGYAGFNGLKDYKNKKDIFGRKFKYSQTDIADGLATSATLCMGEGNEQKPLALISDAPVVFANIINKKELQISPSEDIFSPLFKHIHAKKQK